VKDASGHAGIPPRMALAAGPLPPARTLPDPYPYETIEPVRQGFVERGGVRSWYAQYGDSGPWLAFAPIYQIANSYMLRGVLPWLAQHFRVMVMDLRGNGRSDRPQRPEDYSFDHYHADFLAVLDRLEIASTAVVGISATAMCAIRLAAEQPQRVSHLITCGGWVTMRVGNDPARIAAVEHARRSMQDDWPGFLDDFFGKVFSEPHSTKPYEDAVLRCGGATDGVTNAMGRAGWIGSDVRHLLGAVRCPTLVIHGDDDRIVPIEQARLIAGGVAGARLTVIGGGGHLLPVRDPVVFARMVHEFAGLAPRDRTWVRGMARKRKALFVSSAIGLGHVQRDLAIVREMRKLQPDLEVDWFTVPPATTYLEREGERVHPACARLANESRHFESRAGEHDLQAFFALRTMDEVMARNFLVFADLLRAEHYDMVIGDEAWDVDYHFHEYPELKRQPFVFLTDFIGCLPMEEGNEREAYLCADRNADDIEHVARYPWIRDRAIFVGNQDDTPELPFGPGLPVIRDWAERNFTFTGYALPFDPAALADTDALRHKHGYARDDKLVVAAVGGTAVGTSLLTRIGEAFPHMRTQVPGLRMILVAGPRVQAGALPQHEGLEVRPYVHNLFEHLACSDLALVQGGLSTCMELVATRRRFLSFPLERHFEQCIHVRHRLRNYCADCAVRFSELGPRELADVAVQALHAPVNYKPVETDGARRAAAQILAVLENRHWATA
jgi:pimeloyl-ACP methyl ester carboxylesterase/predicted glycosyltransferase